MVSLIDRMRIFRQTQCGQFAHTKLGTCGKIAPTKLCILDRGFHDGKIAFSGLKMKKICWTAPSIDFTLSFNRPSSFSQFTIQFPSIAPSEGKRSEAKRNQDKPSEANSSEAKPIQAKRSQANISEAKTKRNQAKASQASQTSQAKRSQTKRSQAKFTHTKLGTCAKFVHTKLETWISRLGKIAFAGLKRVENFYTLRGTLKR